MQNSFFGEEEMTPKSSEYLVLARKYRPATFKDMVGQDVLVKTFTNAIKSGRVAHAFLLTGIRGVGKTTTARIIARALNCIGPDGDGNVTDDPCGVCAHCTAIAADRHQDVLEMDAASHTGVNDIREIIESAKYKPISARYKVYIIDEVHMLSNSAFNALLKTLEEPPAHVKFIFATTEIRKIPITILSRCQKFDLKRVEIKDLVSHFENILSKENITVNNEALKIIAANAHGSVRDGLSLLDQALSHTNNSLNAESVREMLGLSDFEENFKLIEFLLRGEISDALKIATEMYQKGAEPSLLINDLLLTVHNISKLKVLNNIDEYSEVEGKKLKTLSDNVEVSTLARTWQMLSKGLDEIRFSASQFQALEMILIRIAYMSSLPPAEEIIEKLKTRPKASVSDQQNTASREPEAQKKTLISSFEEIMQALFTGDEMMLYHQVKSGLVCTNFLPNYLELKASNSEAKKAAVELQSFLEKLTSEKWNISIEEDKNIRTIADQEKESKISKVEEIKNHELVQTVLNSFTGMEIADIKVKNIA